MTSTDSLVRPYGISMPANAWQRALPKWVFVLAAAVPVYWLVVRAMLGLVAWTTFTIMFYVAIPVLIALLVVAWCIHARAGIVSPRAAGPGSSWLYALFLPVAAAWPLFLGEDGISGPIRPAPVTTWFGLSPEAAAEAGNVLVWTCVGLGTLLLIVATLELLRTRSEFLGSRGREAR